MMLPASALRGTDLACSASCLRDAVCCTEILYYASCLRASHAMSGTEIAYAATCLRARFAESVLR
eukprot:3941278-Rhodomonas_salina.3